LLCVPSQNGFVVEAPHRQSANLGFPETSTFAPVASKSSSVPSFSTRYGPFGLHVILIGIPAPYASAVGGGGASVSCCRDAKPSEVPTMPPSNAPVVGMKSYGRAPTFLMLTGCEQVRSIVAALSEDWESARKVDLVLPETGVYLQ
jgi:hypothetical protein